MNSRAKRMVNMVQNESNTFPQYHCVFLPKHESTKGTTLDEKENALGNWDICSEISEDKTSGSEYVPDSADDTTSSVKPTDNWWEVTEENKKSKQGNSVRKVQNWLKDQNKIQTTSKETKNICKTAKKKLRIQDSNTEHNKKRKINILQNITVKDANAMKLCLENNSKNNADARECKVSTLEKQVEDEKGEKGQLTDESAEDVIIHSAKKRHGKRIRSKRHSCYFCNKTFINMARHFETLHANEVDIAKILAMEKNSHQRKEAFTALIRVGDFNHNCEILTLKKGELILVRRPTETETKFYTYSDYGPCPHCLGFMLKKHLWHHVKQCTEKKESNVSMLSSNKNIIGESNAILFEVFGKELSSSYIKNIVCKIREDKIGKCCANDPLILKFGAMQFEKHYVTQAELIRQSMRQLGRLVIRLREVSKNEKSCLADFLKPEKFDTIVLATKLLCVSQMDSTKRPEFNIPSLALKIGYALKKCASIERGLALKKGDLKRDDILKSFIKVMELEWAVRVSSNALNTMYKRKMNATQLLPLTTDLVKVNKFLDHSLHEARINLEKDSTAENWQVLAIYTLGKIILFNKRRSGEAARMTLENYISRPAWSKQCTQEIKNSMSPFEKKLAETLTIVEIVGKRARKVPVILTKETKNSIDLLINKRVTCGIPPENPYVFARSKNSLGYLRGHDSLNKICTKANISDPQTITSTKLRKYMATVSQLFNLTENECDWLARHLGHDIKVHREFYRLHESAVELTKVSRLLLAVDSGQASQFTGKKLKDINIEDLPVIEEDEEAKSDEEKETEFEGNYESGQSYSIHNPYTDAKRNVPNIEDDFIDSDKKFVRNNKDDKKEKKNITVVPVPWSTEEKESVFKYFRVNIKNAIVPGKADCMKCIEQFPVLQGRDWKKVKFCIKNQITKMRKLKCSTSK